MTDLSHLDNDWDQAPDGDIPDGIYQAKVQVAKIIESKSTGDPFLVLELELVGGSASHIGEEVSKFYGLTAEKIGYLKKDMAKMDIRGVKPSELSDNLERFLDRMVEIQLKSKGPYQNCWINRLVTNGELPSVPPEDDIPF